MKNNSSRQRKPLMYYLGNFLIFLSLFGFAFIFYPFIKMYFFPPPIENIQTVKGYLITIPKIHAQAPIIDNIDPWHESAYREALHHGIAHAKGFVEPGEIGISYFFAHSSGAPWELTRYNTVFLRLGELQTGDQIFITKNNERYVYTVTRKKIIWPTDVAALQYQTKKKELVLQTCTPIGTALQRLLVFAVLTNLEK